DRVWRGRSEFAQIVPRREDRPVSRENDDSRFAVDRELLETLAESVEERPRQRVSLRRAIEDQPSRVTIAPGVEFLETPFGTHLPLLSIVCGTEESHTVPAYTVKGDYQPGQCPVELTTGDTTGRARE